MATIFPDYNRSRVVFASKAEETFYQLCRKLSRDWTVYYSCTLSALEPGKGLQDNEIDFVLYHPQWGLFVIEVKGGQIKYDAEQGTFSSVNRHGKSFSIRNPFQQALIWKSRFLRFLKGRGIRVPATHLVCFPSVVESDIEAGAEIEPKLILGRTRLAELESYLKSICKEVHPEKFRKFEDVKKDLDRALKGASYSTRLYIRDYLDNHEMKVRDIESIHESLVTPVAGAKRLAVEGEAGTGKTMLAIMLAKHFRNLGKKVLLLSSNPILNSFMKKDVGESVAVKTYAELASAYGVELLRRPSGFEGKREDWIQYVGPEKLKEAILQSDLRYDVLLCDEAQDVQPFWWESIESVLASEESNFYIFFDRSQGVFGSGSADTHFIPEDVLPIDTPYFPLVNNYRTTKEISSFSRSFRTGKEILRSHSGRLGYLPKLIVYKDAADGRRKLDELLTRLYQVEGLHPNETTILSGRKPFHDGSILKGHQQLGNHQLINLTELKANAWSSDIKHKAMTPVSTITGFKGLETHVGIITNLSEYNLPLSNPIMSSLFYVACTRAKHMLYVMVKEGDEKHLQMREALDKLDLTGSMVVDRTTINNEFVGEVISYNPSRLGWLKVKDPGLGVSQIMFFPYDIKRDGIFNIKAGSKLRFTPRTEGHVMIACDLKLVKEEADQSQATGS